MNFPAFKEWHVIVEALGAGEQILLLRKGGIAEARGGFTVATDRFWLFPTHFHAQLQKTKPAARRWFERATPSGQTVPLRWFAQLERTVFLNDWPRVAALDRFHFWSEDTVRERFDWSRPPGLHALVVRVHELSQPMPLAVTPDMGGCKSWIEVPVDFTARPSAPVLPDAVFAARVAELGLPPGR